MIRSPILFSPTINFKAYTSSHVMSAGFPRLVNAR